MTTKALCQVASLLHIMIRLPSRQSRLRGAYQHAGNYWRKSASGVRRAKAALSSGCKSHPANSLQPEAIGAVMEVTKWLKPSISVSRIGDSASVQAAT